VAIAAVLVALHIVRNRRADSALPLAALFAFAVLVAIRTLLKTTAWGYSIYCNGPAVLAFLVLVRPVVPRAGRSNRSIVIRTAAMPRLIGCRVDVRSEVRRQLR
jgi:hypothetical protein